MVLSTLKRSKVPHALKNGDFNGTCKRGFSEWSVIRTYQEGLTEVLFVQISYVCVNVGILIVIPEIVNVLQNKVDEEGERFLVTDVDIVW